MILNWIELSTMLITALTAISSIIIAINTLEQNNQMIEDATRPYIMIYKDAISINSPIEYLVIENFGSSAGTISEMKYDKDIFTELIKEKSVDLNLLKYFNNITLAPHQKYMISINTRDVANKTFKIQIKYNSSTNSYTDEFNVNLSQDYSLTFDKQHKTASDKEIFTISSALQELIKRK